MPRKDETYEAVLVVLAAFGDRGASAREVRDALETPERGSRTFSKSVVRRRLEAAVGFGEADRTQTYPAKQVTYVAAK